MAEQKIGLALLNDENTVVLETYAYDDDGIGIDGESMSAPIDKAWLENEIAPQTLDEFLSEYTYDDAEELYRNFLDTPITKWKTV